MPFVTNLSTSFSSRPSFQVAVSTVLLSGIILGGCASSVSDTVRQPPKFSPRVAQIGDNIPRGGGRYKLGQPYTVNGITYVPQHQPQYDGVGIASWYGDMFHGRLTANGEVYDMDRLTAAHPTLPLPSLVRVTNRSNGRQLIVRVNDRGPYAKGRIIDLSRRSAEMLGLKHAGTGEVRVQYLGPAPLDGNDVVERQFADAQRSRQPTAIASAGWSW